MVIAFFFERGFRPIGNFLYINGFSMEHPASKQIAHKTIKAVEGVFVFSYLANIVLCDIIIKPLLIPSAIPIIGNIWIFNSPANIGYR